MQVASPTNLALTPFTDPHFRGFDNSLPDYWRNVEWARDIDARYKNNHHAGRTTSDMPALTLVRLMHDHTGNHSVAIDGVNTPDLEEATTTMQWVCWWRRSPRARSPTTP